MTNVSHYVRLLMSDLQARGRCQELVPYPNDDKAKSRARTRIQNAAGRLGVKVTTHIDGDYVVGEVVA